MMKTFNQRISLVKNSRGCYILDTVKGCSVCAIDKPKGCYDNCYAKLIADRYKLDFSSPVIRKFQDNSNQVYLFDFHDTEHISQVIREIKSIDMPFVRIGEMGDPSEDWEHTLNVCGIISSAKKHIVIITKHWNQINESLLDGLRMLPITINTSVSALDSPQELEYRLKQYERLKPYCNSVLRIVTCDFNKNNERGIELSEVQDYLLTNYKHINTAFRPSKDNKLVVDGVINTSKKRFLRSMVIVSAYDKDVFLGHCKDCKDLCGIKED